MHYLEVLDDIAKKMFWRKIYYVYGHAVPPYHLWVYWLQLEEPKIFRGLEILFYMKQFKRIPNTDNFLIPEDFLEKLLKED